MRENELQRCDECNGTGIGTSYRKVNGKRVNNSEPCPVCMGYGYISENMLVSVDRNGVMARFNDYMNI